MKCGAPPTDTKLRCVQLVGGVSWNGIVFCTIPISLFYSLCAIIAGALNGVKARGANNYLGLWVNGKESKGENQIPIHFDFLLLRKATPNAHTEWHFRNFISKRSNWSAFSVLNRVPKTSKRRKFAKSLEFQQQCSESASASTCDVTRCCNLNWPPYLCVNSSAPELVLVSLGGGRFFCGDYFEMQWPEGSSDRGFCFSAWLISSSFHCDCECLRVSNGKVAKSEFRCNLIADQSGDNEGGGKKWWKTGSCQVDNCDSPDLRGNCPLPMDDKRPKILLPRRSQ